MTTVVDQVITIFDAVWKGDAAAKSSLKSLEQYRSVSSKTAVAHQQQAIRADSLKSSMLGLGATIGISGQTAETAAEEFINLNTQLMGAEQEMERLIPTTQTTGDKLKGIAAAAGTAMLALGAVTIALKATYGAMKQVYDIAKEGAEIRQMRESFDGLNASVMHTPTLLRDMVDATNGTISEMSAMEGIMTLVAGSSEELTQEFARAAPKLAEIAKAANKLNPRLGDTNFMFASIARGVKRLEPRLLDNLGINARSATANIKFAEAMGITVKAMTAEQKVLALLNETLFVGGNLIEQVGGNVESSIDGYLALEAATENLKNSYKSLFGTIEVGQKTIAQHIQDEGDQVAVIEQTIKAQKDGIAGWSEINRWQEMVNEGTMTYTPILDVLAARYVQVGIEEARQIAYLKEIEVNVEAVGDSWMEGFGEGPQKEIRGATEELHRFNDEILTMKEGLLEPGADAGLSLERLLKPIRAKAAVDSAKEAVKEIDNLIKSIREMDAATGDYAMQAYDAERGSGLFNESIADIGTSWVETGGRTKEQNELLEDLQDAYDKTGKNMRDTEIGIKNFAMTQENVNKKLEEGAAAQFVYTREMEKLKNIHGEWSQVTTTGTWNQENINKAVLDAADAAGASADELVKYMLATGEITEVQAEAILEQAKMGEAIKQWGQDIDESIDADKVIAEIEAIKIAIRNMDLDELLGVKKEWRGVDASKFEEGIPIPEGQIVEVGMTEDADDVIDDLENMREGANIIIEADGVDAQNTLDGIWATIQNISGTHQTKIEVGYTGSQPPGPPQEQFGGPMQQGASYWVGERGPELFTPNVNGNLTPTGQTSGGGSIVVNNYNREAAAITATMMGLRQRAMIGL